MIHIQLLGRVTGPTVLAAELVPLEQVLTIEFHFLYGQAIIGSKQKDLWDQDLLTHGMNDAA